MTADNDMSKSIHAAFDMYSKMNVGGFVGDSKMNTQQFVKMCQDGCILEPNGALDERLPRHL